MVTGISTQAQSKKILEACRSLFQKKYLDYGSAWRILRLPSITDQLWIKAKRIRSIQEKKQQKVSDSILDEFIGLVNYAIIALIQIELINKETLLLEKEETVHQYDKQIQVILTLLEKKNHDYDEAWRDMRVEGITDIILMKLLRIKQIEKNNGQTLVSENLPNHYKDIINYAVFCLILSKFQESN